MFRGGIFTVTRKAAQSVATASSTSTASSTVPSKNGLKMPEFGSQSSFSHYSAWELMRALLVYRSCSYQFLVHHSVSMLSAVDKVFGDTLTYNTVVKWTFFSHFCAGTDEHSIMPVVKRLADHGLGGIYDYAAEKDVVADMPKHRKQSTTFEPDMRKLIINFDIQYDKVNTYFDACADRFVRSIKHADDHRSGPGIPYAAIKVTALCDPQLLARMTSIQMYVRQTWVAIIRGDSSAPEISECRVITDREVKTGRDQTSISIEAFADGLTGVFPSISKECALAIGKAMDKDNNGRVEYLDYTHHLGRELFNPERTIPPLSELVRQMHPVTKEELSLITDLKGRLEKIGAEACKRNVKVLVDAEQTFYQMAIDMLVRWMQHRFNKEKAIIYNTYQAYLDITCRRLQNDMLRARRNKWVFAAKLVRGAYMVQEKSLSDRYDYRYPICSSKEATDHSYNQCALIMIKELKRHPDAPIGIVFATHNEQSLRLICEELQTGISDHVVAERIAFGQLYGMSDQLSFPLAKAGYKVIKVLPYGPVKETIHYLHRRAIENSGMLAHAKSEKTLLWNELKSRFVPSSK